MIGTSSMIVLEMGIFSDNHIIVMGLEKRSMFIAFQQLGLEKEAESGSDERLILIHSFAMIHGKDNSGEDQDPVAEKEDTQMKPHCSNQDALLKVHDRIISEDLVDGNGDDNETEVTARLLLSNNVVGCILGRKGDVIQRLQSDTGASIRVLPAEHLPACAQNTDELVQISGKPGLVKTALYEVSTLLHQSPKKENLISLSTPQGTLAFRPPGRPVDIPPPGITGSYRHFSPPVPWEGGYQRAGFSESPARSEFAMKIVCPAGKTKQDIRNRRSPTIDAILHLQDQTSEKGSHYYKPSGAVEQGGHIINQIRKRTLADIRVYAKKDKPKYAEELFQIAGSVGVVKDALAEGERCLREATAESEPAVIRPLKAFDHDRNFPHRVSDLPGSMRGGSSSRYEFGKFLKWDNLIIMMS